MAFLRQIPATQWVRLLRDYCDWYFTEREIETWGWLNALLRMTELTNEKDRIQIQVQE